MLGLAMWVGLAISTAEAKEPKDPWCWVHFEDSKLYAGKSLLIFQTREEIAADEAESAANELREPKPTPDMAIVGLRIYRLTLDGAKPETQTVVVIDAAGKEIARQELDGHTPDTPTHSGINGAYWRGLGVMKVDGPIGYPLTVHAADSLHKQRCTWTVQADGSAVWLKPEK